MPQSCKRINNEYFYFISKLNMKNKFYNKGILYIIVVFQCAINIHAQTDWRINPNDFEYNMTVTSMAYIPCSYTMDSRDQVGAFVNGELRGVGYFDVLDQDKYYCFLVIYDSLYSGNVIQFKLYDASEDTIYDALDKMTFTDNKIVGSSSNPFVFQVVSPLDELLIDQDSLHRLSPIGTKLASMFLVNLKKDTVSASFSFVDDSFGLNNNLFEIQGNELFLSKDISHIGQNELFIHIIGKSKNDCPIDQKVKIKITNHTVQTSTIGNLLSIKMFPNPVKNDLFIETEISFDFIQIFDPLGKCIMQVPNKIENSVDLTQLTPGIYYINLLKEKRLVGNAKIIHK